MATTTQYRVNTDIERFSHALARTTLLVIVDYRGAVHPTTGSHMNALRAAAVENYLQWLVISKRSRESSTLRLSRWTYALAQRYSSDRVADDAFVRLARWLARPLLTPNSSGLRSGVPFWGSCSALKIDGHRLRAVLSHQQGHELESLIGAARGISRAPFKKNALYSAPVRSLAGPVHDTADPMFPILRAGTGTMGSYPHSRRYLVGSPGARSDRAATVAPLVDGFWPVECAIDVWGTWAEVTPYDGAGGAAWDDGVRRRHESAHVSRDLEPLIGELWRRVDAIPERFADLQNELHLSLIGVSDAVRSQERSVLRTALSILLSAVAALALELAAAYVWDEYGEAIRRFIDRLS